MTSKEIDEFKKESMKQNSSSFIQSEIKVALPLEIRDTVKFNKKFPLNIGS